MSQSNAQSRPSESGLSLLAGQVSERLNETAQAIDDVTRATCLMALDAAITAGCLTEVGAAGLAGASCDVRALAARTYRTLADLEGMLETVENRSR